jgi:hypothetical protein
MGSIIKNIAFHKLDPDFEIPVYGYCVQCVHLNHEKFILGERSCAAFDDIPLPIWKGENEHKESYPSDKGFRFTKIVNSQS